MTTRTAGEGEDSITGGDRAERHGGGLGARARSAGCRQRTLGSAFWMTIDSPKVTRAAGYPRRGAVEDDELKRRADREHDQDGDEAPGTD
jgi:hypothetical protein